MSSRRDFDIDRQSIWTVLGVYLASGWAVIEVIGTLVERLLLPDWIFRAALALLLIGLPIVLLTRIAQQRLREAPENTAGIWRFLRWRHALAGGMLAFGFLGAVAVISVLSTRPVAERADDDTGTALAVFPFAIRGNPDLEFLHEGMPDVLSQNLGSLDGVRIVPSGSIIRLAGLEGPDAVMDAQSASAIAEDLGARMFVLGSITEIGGELRMTASLHRVDQPNVALASPGVVGSPDEIPDLIDELAVELLIPSFGRASARALRSAARATESQPALRAFLEGEQAIRASRYTLAVDRLRLAIAEDSSFALAHFRSAIAVALMETDGSYSELVGMLPNALPQALEYADRLNEYDRTLLDAYRDFRLGNGDQAEQGFREILRDNPDDLEASFLLGQVLFRLNAPRGRPLAEAKAPFELVLARDPDFICPI